MGIMRNINVRISDYEFNQLGLKTENIQFTELVDVISKELSKQALNKSVLLAKKYNLSTFSMDDITGEVKAARDAKGNS